jgi:hypothetical protein
VGVNFALYGKEKLVTIKTHFIAAALSVTGFAVMAAEPSPSEFFYQTPAGQSAGTIQAGYLDREYKVTNNGASVGTAADKGLSQAGVRYEVGLTDMWSLEGALTYSLIKRDPASSTADSADANGLDDFQLNLKGTSHMTGFRLRYGLSNRIGLFAASYSTTGGGANEFNNSSGRFTFTPYLGADISVGPGLLGAKVSYDLIKQDVALHGPNGINDVYSGGQDFIVSVFYEWSIEPTLLGVALSYLNEGNSKFDGTAQDNWIMYGANIYARFGWIDGWAIVPNVAYDWNGSKSNVDYYTVNTIDSGQEWKFNLALRTTF